MKIPISGLRTILVIIVFYFAFSLFNYSRIDEDAFIFFRVAEYLVNGYGYVFNPGERVEACSSVSWLFILTFFQSIGFNVLTTSKILGILFGCFSLLLVFKITKRFTTQMPWVILPSLLTSFSLPFIMWNQMGLDTSLYTLVLLVLVYICLNKDLFFYWPIIAIILVLTRPEGMFLLLGLTPALYFHKGKKLILSASLFLALLLGVIFIRFIYFHDFLPSAFYIKMYENKYLTGLNYIHLYLKDHYLYYFCIPLLCILPRKFNWQKERVVLFGFMIVYLAWIILGGGESKPFYRHTVPFILFLYIYLITGIEQLIGVFTTKKKVLISIYLTIFCTATLFLSSNYGFYKQIKNPVSENIKSFIKNPPAYLQFRLGRTQNPAKINNVGRGKTKQLLIEFVKRNYISGTTLMYDQMGELPYQVGIDYYFIDSWGLTDKKIGRYYFNERVKNSPFLQLYESISSNLIKRFFPYTEFIHSREEVLNYVFRRNPDVIMINEHLRWWKKWLPNWLIKDKRFRMRYQRKYLIHGTLIFEKRGLKKRRFNIPN